MKIGIIGGGVSGLAAAHRLTKNPNHHVTLYESHALGGLAAGFPLPGLEQVYLEKFYHHIFLSDTELLALLEELGLTSQLVWHPSSVGIYAQGKIWPFTKGLDLLRFKPLGSLYQRFLFGLSALKMRKLTDWKALDTISVKDYYKNLGAESGYNQVWQPLLRAKFGPDSDTIPTAFLWGRIYARFRSRQKGKEVLGYMKGGFQHFVLKLAEQIKKQGGVLKVGAPIEKISLGNPCTVRTSSEEATFDRLIYTGSMDKLAAFIPDQKEKFTELSTVQYRGAICLILVLKKKLGDVYWLNITDPGFPFGGIIEHTNLIGPEQYGGDHVVYLFNYLKAGHDYFSLNEDQMLDLFTPFVQKIYPHFSRSDVKQRYVFKTNYATPVYDYNYGAKLDTLNQSLGPLSFATMAQVYPFDRNMSHGIGVAQNVAADIERH